jgi:hypothetical protein
VPFAALGVAEAWLSRGDGRCSSARAHALSGAVARALGDLGVVTRAECSFLTTAYPDDASKVYVIERHAVAGAFAWRGAALRAAKCLILAYQPAVDDWCKRMEASMDVEKESGELEPMPRFEGGKKELNVACVAFARDTAVAVSRRVCERVILTASSDRLGAKLCKDVKSSAKRKAKRVSWERGLAKIEQSANMFRTTALASAVNALGEWIVDVALSVYATARGYLYNSKRDDAAAAKALRAFGRAVLRAAVKQACVLFGGSAATATFALCRPRGSSQRVVHWGTLLALTAGEFVGSFYYGTVADFFCVPPAESADAPKDASDADADAKPPISSRAAAAAAAADADDDDARGAAST